MLLFSLLPRNFAVWAGIPQRLKTNSGKGKRKQPTGLPSSWMLMIFYFFFEVFGAHFMFNMIHERLQRALPPGATREADQLHVFKCLLLAAPLGPGWAQDSIGGHSWSAIEGLGYFSRTWSEGLKPSQAVVPKPCTENWCKPCTFVPLGFQCWSRTASHLLKSCTITLVLTPMRQLLPNLPSFFLQMEECYALRHPSEDKGQSHSGPALCPTPGWPDGCPLSSHPSTVLGWSQRALPRAAAEDISAEHISFNTELYKHSSAAEGSEPALCRQLKALAKKK